jgi:hypothetical protein
MRYLSDAGTFTGMTRKPLVLQYNNNDPTVPKRYNLVYPALAKAASAQVQPLMLPSAGEGHCGFSPDQIREAFTTLAGWSTSGRRPSGS